jgi:Flp pilus assembly protein TadB
MGYRDVPRPGHEPSQSDGAAESLRERGNGIARASVRTLLAFGAVLVAFFLIAEHRAHTLGVMPYLLLLACPILHLFWHGRHGSHTHGDTSDGR